MMVVRRLLLLTCVLLAAGPSHAVSMKDVELLNATLVARLHFDVEPRKGQMVGAYQVSFRTKSETPIPQVQVLLNPGFEITKVVGAGGKNLRYSADYKTVASQSPLELMAATITLAKPLRKGGRRQEIVIHYKGFLQDLSVSGLSGVKETFHPDFTMIRAQSFGYPVFAEPRMDAVHAAWTHKPFYQVAFLDIPGHNKVVGNLGVGSKTTNGALTKFEMKSETATELMALAIGPYHTEQYGPFSYNFADEHRPGREALVASATEKAAATERLLGPAPANRRLSIIEVPDGFSGFVGTSAYFAGSQPDKAKLESQLFGVWRLNRTSQVGHWGTGLDTIAEVTSQSPQSLKQLQETLFSDLADALRSSPKLGKSPLAEMQFDLNSDDPEVAGVLAYATLYELLGEDAFFALVRDLRAEFSIGYADLAAVGEYLEENLTDKKARKFVQNWFFKGRIGKDLKKAKSFDELVALYR